MTDLDKLIEAVEGGVRLPMDGGAYRLFKDGWLHVFDAYHGSLDAAKALHDALLPGWTRDVDATAPECGITVTLHKVTSFSDSEVISADMPCEARSWILAILKAYRAQVHE